MSFFLSIVQNTGSFDKLTRGGYSVTSACGFVQECEDVKNCIRRVCEPNKDAYGGTFYDGCVQACNGDYTIASVEQYVCQNPETANVYGVDCGGGGSMGDQSNNYMNDILIVVGIFLGFFLLSKLF